MAFTCAFQGAVMWGQVKTVLRGGSWGNNGVNTRSSYRGNYDPSNQDTIVGVRCAR